VTIASEVLTNWTMFKENIPIPFFEDYDIVIVPDGDENCYDGVNFDNCN